MTIDISPIALWNAADKRPEEAELWDAITETQLSDWEKLWKVDLQRILQTDPSKRSVVESRHWDWRKKAEVQQRFLALRGFSIMCAGETQGMMIVDTTTKHCLIQSQSGKNLVYVDYLESAPWNRAALRTPPKYSGVGSILIRAAIALSEEEGFKGRIGLHSLPMANDFYTKTCGMTCLGPDPHYQGLSYFELTPEGALAFITKGNGP